MDAGDDGAALVGRHRRASVVPMDDDGGPVPIQVAPFIFHGQHPYDGLAAGLLMPSRIRLHLHVIFMWFLIRCGESRTEENGRAGRETEGVDAIRDDARSAR